MRRALLGALAAALATAAAFYVLGASFDGPRGPLAAGVVAGGILGALLAAASAGAQVVLVERRPESNASYAAMVAGFFAKGAALVVGILLCRGGSAVEPASFAISFLVSAALVTSVALSALVRRGPP